jgi:hypothetical protein
VTPVSTSTPLRCVGDPGVNPMHSRPERDESELLPSRGFSVGERLSHEDVRGH